MYLCYNSAGDKNEEKQTWKNGNIINYISCNFNGFTNDFTKHFTCIRIGG